MAGTSYRHALLLNLYGSPADEAESLSLTFQSVDLEDGDDPDPVQDLRSHARQAATDDIALLARLLKGQGYTVSVPMVTARTAGELQPYVTDARRAVRPVTPPPPMSVAAGAAQRPAGRDESSESSTSSSRDHAHGNQLLLVVVVGELARAADDDGHGEEGPVRVLLPSHASDYDPHARDGGGSAAAAAAGDPSTRPSVSLAELNGWARDPSYGPCVPTVTVAEVNALSQTAFRASIDDGDDSASSVAKTASGAPPHHGISGIHFIMYSTGQTLCSLLAQSLAMTRPGHHYSVSQLQRDIERRAGRLRHFAGPSYEGPVASSTLVLGGVSTTLPMPSTNQASLNASGDRNSLSSLIHGPFSSASTPGPAGPLGMSAPLMAPSRPQSSVAERYDAFMTLSCRQIETHRVTDTLADAVNDFGSQVAVRLKGVEWCIDITLDSEGASEETIRRDTLQFLEELWDTPWDAVEHLVSFTLLDATCECMVSLRDEHHRRFRALLKHLLAIDDPCIGRFAVFRATLSVEMRLRCAASGLILALSRTRGAQFGHALGVQEWNAQLHWQLAVIDDDSRPSSGLQRVDSALRGSSSSFAPTPGFDSSAASALQDEATIAALALVQRVGRGKIARESTLWTATGVPRSQQLLRLAIAATRVDTTVAARHAADPLANALPTDATDLLTHVATALQSPFLVIALTFLSVLSAACAAGLALTAAHVAAALSLPVERGGVSPSTAAVRLIVLMILSVIARFAVSSLSLQCALGAASAVERSVVAPADALGARRRRGVLSERSLDSSITALTAAVCGTLTNAARLLDAMALVISAAVMVTEFNPDVLVRLLVGCALCALAGATAPARCSGLAASCVGALIVWVTASPVPARHRLPALTLVVFALWGVSALVSHVISVLDQIPKAGGILLLVREIEAIRASVSSAVLLPLHSAERKYVDEHAPYPTAATAAAAVGSVPPPLPVGRISRNAKRSLCAAVVLLAVASALLLVVPAATGRGAACQPRSLRCGYVMDSFGGGFGNQSLSFISTAHTVEVQTVPTAWSACSMVDIPGGPAAMCPHVAGWRALFVPIDAAATSHRRLSARVLRHPGNMNAMSMTTPVLGPFLHEL